MSQITAPTDTKAAPTTTVTAELTAPTNAQNVTSNNILQLASETPLPPIPQDEVANTTTLTPADQVPVPLATNDIIISAPPPAYMSVDPAKRSVPVNPTTGAAQRPENYVIELKDLGEFPEFVDCPHCHTRQKTQVQQNGNSQQGTAACLCCLFCGVIGAIIPLCCNWCADIDHVCPHCHKMVAHMPYEGKMEPVLPNPGPAYKPSQFQPPSAPPK